MFIPKGDFYINNQDYLDCFLKWSWRNCSGNNELCIDYLERFCIEYCKYNEIDYNPREFNIDIFYNDEVYNEFLYYLRKDVDLFKINDEYELAQIRFAVVHFHEFIIMYYELWLDEIYYY